MNSNFMPPEASTIAGYFDSLYGFLVAASFISCVLVIGGLIWFALKYQRKAEGEKTPYISHSTLLEFLWSFIPFVIFMIVFVWGWWLFDKMRTVPEGALEVNVMAQKWNWDFLYKSGRKTSSEFYVPINTPVKMIMTSKDVIHSFYVPAFRIKQDVVPGIYTSVWFEATKEGTFQLFCTEYCGEGHSAMLAKIHVLPKDKYEEWLSNDPYKGLSLIEIGQKLFTAKQCVTCHNTDGTKKIGPGLGGLFGRAHDFVDGSKLAAADENYIRESILNPNARVVAGYPPGLMPTFQGQLSEQELAGIIEYLKSLKQ